MHADDTQPIFTEERIRQAGVTGFAAGLLVPIAALVAGLFTRWLLAGAVGGWLALAVGLLVGWGVFLASFDYLTLGWFNRRLRGELADKLLRLGAVGYDLADPNVYFVGLAHPARVSWARWETDDDVGFVRVSFEGLEYQGDRLSFRADFRDIESISLEPIGYGLPAAFKRIRIRFADAEPFEELLLCSREGDRLTSGNAVTQTLYEALRSRWERRASVRLRGEIETESPLLAPRS